MVGRDRDLFRKHEVHEDIWAGECSKYKAGRDQDEMQGSKREKDEVVVCLEIGLGSTAFRERIGAIDQAGQILIYQSESVWCVFVCTVRNGLR